MQQEISCIVIFQNPRYLLKTHFSAHCSFYSRQLRCIFKSKSFQKLHVVYNNSYRIAHKIPCSCSACPFQIQANNESFNALIRKLMIVLLNAVAHLKTHLLLH